MFSKYTGSIARSGTNESMTRRRPLVRSLGERLSGAALPGTVPRHVFGVASVGNVITNVHPFGGRFWIET